MKMRPVEKVLFQTLEDIDPEQATRLKAELYGSSSFKDAAWYKLFVSVLPLILAVIAILGLWLHPIF